MEAAGSPAQSPAGAQAPLSPERQPVHLMGQATVTPETTPDRAMSPPEALRGRNPPDPTEEVVWFPTPLKPLEILDAMAHPAVYEQTEAGGQRKKPRTSQNQLGKRVEVNGKQLAVFRIGPVLFAAQEACVHMEGPMSLGDIEDVGGLACLVCPKHGWSYEILSEGVLSGRCTNRPDRTQPLYPVREGADGTLLIGFEKINAAIFDDDDF